ncbi:hypothetical protein Tco_1016398 [Tanacetum coccineum]|uniref:Uncharacterized protein n=1 Tax=Tanacetum coccineum TaxID=301880 RepID=A0ABQ5FNK1_9ASTR
MLHSFRSIRSPTPRAATHLLHHHHPAVTPPKPPPSSSSSSHHHHHHHGITIITYITTPSPPTKGARGLIKNTTRGVLFWFWFGGCLAAPSTKEGALSSRHNRKGAFVLGDSHLTRVRLAVTAYIGRVWLSCTSRVRMVRGSAAGLRLAQQPQIRPKKGAFGSGFRTAAGPFAYVQGEVVEGMNATNETANVQRIVRTPTPGNTSTGQCYNLVKRNSSARSGSQAKVRDSKYFMEQMLVGNTEMKHVEFLLMSNDFLLRMLQRMEEIEELNANTCLIARIQPQTKSYDESSYDRHFNIQFDSSKRNVMMAVFEKIHMLLVYIIRTLSRMHMNEAAKQQIAQNVLNKYETLTS